VKKFPIFIFALLLLNGIADADPSIISVSGTFAHGESVTISVSNPGVKSPAAPYFYDNFEGGSNGSSISGQSGTVGTETWYYEGSTAITYTNSISYGQGSISLYKQSDGDDFAYAGINSLNSTTVYLSYRWRVSVSGTNYQTDVFKLARITDTGGWYNTDPTLKPQIQYHSSWAYDGIDDCVGGNTSDTFSLPAQNTWHRAEIYAKMNNPAGTANGVIWTAHDFSVNMNSSSIEYITSGCSGDVFDSFITPFDVANNGAQTWTFWCDNVYFDKTPARVEIGDASTWAACTNREIQIPSAWSDGTPGSITLTVNQGTFESLIGKYIYVIDNSNNISIGYQITAESPPSTQTITGMTIY
jgi:hypothetical protein